MLPGRKGFERRSRILDDPHGIYERSRSGPTVWVLLIVILAVTCIGLTITSFVGD